MTAVVNKASAMHPLVEKYLRPERMPHLACPGCGIGQVVHCTLNAIEDLGLTPMNTIWVQGVGCSSRISYALWKGDSIDAHHGRIFAVATGMKMCRPDLNYILFTGDGDCASIGGNHFLHACRRNLDVVALMFNNGIYGMTGGQVAPTTPLGAKTTTTPHGNFEEPFDLCKVAVAAGASYVARWRATDFKQLTRSINKGLQIRGLAFIEVMLGCATNFGRYVLKSGDPKVVLKWINDRTVTIKKAKKMSQEELEGKFLIGEFAERERPGVVDRYQDIVRLAYEDKEDDQ